jgi:uncharacterized protein
VFAAYGWRGADAMLTRVALEPAQRDRFVGRFLDGAAPVAIRGLPGARPRRTGTAIAAVLPNARTSARSAAIPALGGSKCRLRPVALVAPPSQRHRTSSACLVTRRFGEAATVEVDMTSPTGEPLTPVTIGERIEELDVVRGFALVGIFLMNVEFFNRPIAAIGEGMPRGLTGLDWFASWFIAYFVQGKFWTIFSLLFGMGFAVMLTRAERANRTFIAPYLRRILALAVFGALHFIFIWSGDILFSYAAAAGGLLVLLYAKWWQVLIALVPLVGLAFVPGLHAAAGQVAGALAFIALLALYMRSEKKVNLRLARIPLFSLIFLIIGTVGVMASVVLWVLPDGPKEPRLPVTAISGLLLITAFLSARYHDPVQLRSLRLGVSLYSLLALMLIVVGAVQYLSPADRDDSVVRQVAADPAMAAGTAPSAPSDIKPATGGAASTRAEKERAARAKRLAEHLERKRNEERVLSSGTYAEVFGMRAREFPEKVANDIGSAAIAMGMFLLGMWFVRAGVMENVGAHLRLFRGLAWYGLPFGIGLGLLGSLLATSHTPGSTTDGFRLASGLATLGSLPASLGYVSLVVLALHSNSVFARIRVLAPVGRMALTNYLTQSVISTFVFYGYGAGQWGLARSWQVVYVAAVFMLQVAFSHWWLARFRYGPMEWLWRAFTYRKNPAMRLSTPAA